jgi:signal transduction histidine kinase
VIWPLGQMVKAERWMAWLRLGAVLFAVFQIAVLRDDYPPGYDVAAWITTACFAAGALAIWGLALRDLSRKALARLGLAALAFDTAIVSSYVLVYSFQPGTPVRLAFFIPVVEAAFRFALVGGVVLPFVLVPVAAAFEALRSGRAGTDFQVDYVTFPAGVQVIAGLIVGWLVRELQRATATAERRAAEAERLRDQLGRRVDVLEAASRCARALGSSLELDQAVGAFIRELRGLVPFDRMAIVLVEDGDAEVIATAGRGAEEVFPPGSTRPVEGSALEAVLAGEVLYREDIADGRHPEERELLALGLRARLAAPLLAGPRVVGMLALMRATPASFRQEEIDLVTLLGRLVATGAQNIRSYEAERHTVEELRRLSALRADFVSLVSHELRSPMAAVIGSARTLQERWRELTPGQREAFLALIADETTRLASLVGDVLDTSRIEAGTFSYSFSSVEVGELVRETVAAAGLSQDEVSVAASVRDPLPPVRGDRERLRQVLNNLVENAVKYSPAGAEVKVAAYPRASRVHVEVVDAGPGIPAEHQRLIFEKFGRAKTDGAKPGTGLGLFIARSIVEAHGGTLEVRSAPGQGATFTLALPAGAAGNS